MLQESILVPDETAVITNVSRSFARQMRWNYRWELEDIYQELCLFWLKKKRSGWQKPQGEWKGAMGRCLVCYLKDLQKRECLENARTNGFLASLDALIEDGFDVPAPDKGFFPFDFLASLNTPESLICNLLTQGQSKSAIAQRLGKSRSFVHRRIRYVRHLAEEIL